MNNENRAGMRATYGNNAYQYDYNADAEEDYTLIPDRIDEKKYKKDIVLTEIKRKKEDRKIKRSVIINIVIIVILGLVVAFRYASVTQINYENHKLEQEYERLTDEADIIQLEIESNMSIAEIAQQAEKRLGMHKPFSYQIEYVKVETIDQTEYKNAELTKDEAEDAPWYERAYNSIRLFLGLI